MPDHRLVSIDVDAESLSATTSDIDHERKVAMHDLLAENSFRPCEADYEGPYGLLLAERDGRLVFDVKTEDGEPVAAHHLSLSPLKKTIKDYFMLCETYYDAVRGAMPEKLETIDMARRAVHDEGTRTLMERLEGKITVDFDTARRLFTLICSFSMRASNRGDV
ncbi:UPF0262 family protein [Parvularcula oceani]|uniref:UPF0262 family protein n=1 Tax=Parvularcula oceani TaxID=1247963 RepID=UPI0005663A69|nr:UPF0262 family protein [Parvularcula oceani]